jgi:hypothetical protein
VLAVPAVLNSRNVPLRLALAAAGFRADRPGASAAGDSGAARRAVFRLVLDGLPG